VISIVVPAYNEAGLLASMIEAVSGALARGEEQYEIVIAENGSTDDTNAIARRLEGADDKVRLVTLAQADYGAALHAGFLAATGEIVVNFDVDYYDMSFLETAMTRMRSSDAPDIVVGSKRAVGSDDRRSPARRLVTATFSAILRVGFGLKVSDTHGMKAMRRATVLPLVHACKLRTDLFDTEVILRAERSGLRVEEVPVDVDEHRPARTSILRRGFRTVVGLGRLRLALRH
jgi:glycosyltransferase involved in cell wall biosynthesis